MENNFISTYEIYFGKMPETINIISYKEIDLELDIYLDIFKPKACYRNAELISRLYEDKKIEYIEGEVLIKNIPVTINHAWNKYKDKYFDITYELFNNINEVTYYPIVQGTYKQLKNRKFKFDINVDLVTQYYNQSKQKRKIFNGKDTVYSKLQKINI